MKKYSMETYSLFIPLTYLDLTYYIYYDGFEQWS